MNNDYEREFSVTVSQTLSKNTSIFTSNYKVEQDEDSMFSHSIEDENLNDLYVEQHYTIPQLLKILKKDYKHRAMNAKDPKKIAYFNKIAEECSNWTVDDFEVVE